MSSTSKFAAVCAVISCVFALASCGKTATTVDIAATVEAEDTTVTVQQPKEAVSSHITIDDTYYSNLNAFFESRNFDALVHVTPESWATLDTPSRRYPVSYFLDCLYLQGVLRDDTHQIITTYAENGTWHVKAFSADNFNESDLTWGNLGVGKSTDKLDTVTSGEEQLAILLAHYYPNVDNAVVIYMASGNSISGDTCMPEGTIDSM